MDWINEEKKGDAVVFTVKQNPLSILKLGAGVTVGAIIFMLLSYLLGGGAVFLVTGLFGAAALFYGFIRLIAGLFFVASKKKVLFEVSPTHIELLSANRAADQLRMDKADISELYSDSPASDGSVASNWSVAVNYRGMKVVLASFLTEPQAQHLKSRLESILQW